MVDPAQGEELERAVGDLAADHLRHALEDVHSLDELLRDQGHFIPAVAEDSLGAR